ncbi:hypothetical protein ACV229_40235 [Burkholderia sp. MR1-5-21]
MVALPFVPFSLAVVRICNAAIAGSKMNQALGNIIANVIATGAGGAVGGDAGGFSGYNVDRFNRQLHPEEMTLAKQLAEKSKGKYTQAQIEEQMRIMGVSTFANGHESGAPDTLVGQAPTDSGAKWIYAGSTADGKPILTQVTALANLFSSRIDSYWGCDWCCQFYLDSVDSINVVGFSHRGCWWVRE